MYDNLKFKALVENTCKILDEKGIKHAHGGAEPRYKLKSVSIPISNLPQKDQDKDDGKDHVICLVCGTDLTYLAKLSGIDLSEKYYPA